MYLVSDDYGDFKEIMNYKQLKELLIDELINNSKENHQEYDFIKYNLEVLSDIAKEKASYDEIVNELQSYGWHVLNILDIQKGVNDLREYVASKSTDIKVFDDVLKYIDEELK